MGGFKIDNLQAQRLGLDDDVVRREVAHHDVPFVECFQGLNEAGGDAADAGAIPFNILLGIVSLENQGDVLARPVRRQRNSLDKILDKKEVFPLLKEIDELRRVSGVTESFENTGFFLKHPDRVLAAVPRYIDQRPSFLDDHDLAGIFVERLVHAARIRMHERLLDQIATVQTNLSLTVLCVRLQRVPYAFRQLEIGSPLISNKTSLARDDRNPFAENVEHFARRESAVAVKQRL